MTAESTNPEVEVEVDRRTCPGAGVAHAGTQYFDLCPRCAVPETSEERS